MKKIITIIFILLFSSNISAQTYNIIVKFKENKSPKSLIKTYRNFNSPNYHKTFKNFKPHLISTKFFKRSFRSKNKSKPNLKNIYTYSFSNEIDAKNFLASVKKNPNIIYAEKSKKIKIFSTPSDYYYPLQWGLYNSEQPYRSTGGSSQYWKTGIPAIDMNIEPAWDLTEGNSNIIVAVIDTGVDYLHPDLAGNIWVNNSEIIDNSIDDDNNGYVDDIYGYDFYNDDSNPMDDNFHGTHCAGIIGANGNTTGISGVARNIKIMSVKSFNSSGEGYDIGIANAMNYAVNNGADIINCSWGYNGHSDLIEDVFQYADSQGVILVAAAGNESIDVGTVEPARFPEVICVGAVDSNGTLAYFSNYGDKMDVVAPGVDILSTKWSGFTQPNSNMPYSTPEHTLNIPSPNASDYLILNGTSMAAPFVSGLSALVLSHFPSISQDSAIQKILDNCTDLGSPGFDSIYANGLINAFNTLTSTTSYSPPGGQLNLQKVYAYPNPADSAVRISFVIENTADKAELFILSKHGKVLKKITEKNLNIGINKIAWDLTTQNNQSVGNGGYYWILKVSKGNQSEVKKGYVSILK